MIKLNHLNKYFFKGKVNAIHVIDDVSLTFETTGLIAILGKSGSGKTTLLNVIGGLDSANGEIHYDDIHFSRYRMNDIDAYRNEHIGYVFQNYLLLNDSSVSENIGLALRMAGYTDSDEIRKRTNVALEAVGMLKYKRRLASALSGGQQQRVAIARALAKDATVIIADEPTGNLDSENSFEIMCILKKLSETRLVILVTHNETLAHDFGDRIIGYADGKIVSDVTNTMAGKSSKSQASFNKLQEQKVYLGGLIHHTAEINGIQLTTFSDEDEKLSLDLKVISMNGKAYLLFDQQKILANPNLQFLPGQPPQQDNPNDAMVASKLDTSNFRGKTAEKINVLHVLKNALERFFRPSKTRSKVFNVSMAVLGATLATVSVIFYSTLTNYSTSDYFAEYDQNAVYVNDAGQYEDSISRTDFASLIANEDSGITGSYLSHRATNQLKNFSMVRIPYGLDSYPQYNDVGNYSYTQIYGYPSLFNLTAADVTQGVFPSSALECTIDQSFIDKIMTVYQIRELTQEMILNSTIKVISNVGLQIVTLKIVGITNVGSYYVMLDDTFGPTIVQEILSGLSNYYGNVTLLDQAKMWTYLEKTPAGVAMVSDEDANIPNVYASSAFYDLATRMSSFLPFDIIGYYPEDNLELVLASEEDVHTYFSQNGENVYDCPVSPLSQLDGVTLTSGRMPTAINEVVVSSYLEGMVPSIHEGFSVVGYVDTSFENGFSWYGSLATVEYQTLRLNNIADVSLSPKNTLDDALIPSDLFFSRDIDKTVDFFTQKGHEAIRYGTYVETRFLSASFANNSAFVVTFIVMMGVVILLFYMTTRAKMIKNIYPIGVYRSLGTKRAKIMRLFLSDTVIQTTFTNVASFAVVFALFSKLLTDAGLKAIPFWFVLVGLLFSYAVPLFATWLPLAQLLSKTPNQITTKYDI